MPKSPRLEVTPMVVDGIMYVDRLERDGTRSTRRPAASSGATASRTIDGILERSRHRRQSRRDDCRRRACSWSRTTRTCSRSTVSRAQKLWDVEMGSFWTPTARRRRRCRSAICWSGVAGGEEGARGFVDAYRASTGERVWRFYTIPKRGEKGSETWIGQALEHGCGATWLTGSYDPQLDLVYWAIGNPCPDFAGEERMGDNLYTSSVVALSAKTGELKWYYQFTPHDTHDWDAAQPMMLVDEMWQGRPRKLLMHGDRNGMFYVLDRTQRRVPARRQSFDEGHVGERLQQGRQAHRRSRSIATLEGVAVVPRRRRRRQLARRVVQPDHEAVLRARERQLRRSTSSEDDPLSGNRWFGRGTPGSPAARRSCEALLADYTTRHLHPRDGSVHRQEGLGLPDAGRRTGRAVDGRRPRVSRRRTAACWRSTRRPASRCGT